MEKKSKQEKGYLHRRSPNFGKVPEELMHNKNITDGAVRLYSHMHWRYGSDCTNFESRESMGEYLDVSESTITTRVNELVANDWVIALPRSDQDGRQTNFYHVFELQEDCRKWREQHGVEKLCDGTERRKSRKGVGGRACHKSAKETQVNALQNKLEFTTPVNSSSQNPDSSIQKEEKEDSTKPTFGGTLWGKFDPSRNYLTCHSQKEVWKIPWDVVTEQIGIPNGWKVESGETLNTLHPQYEFVKTLNILGVKTEPVDLAKFRADGVFRASRPGTLESAWNWVWNSTPDTDREQIDPLLAAAEFRIGWYSVKPPVPPMKNETVLEILDIEKKSYTVHKVNPKNHTRTKCNRSVQNRGMVGSVGSFHIEISCEKCYPSDTGYQSIFTAIAIHIFGIPEGNQIPKSTAKRIGEVTKATIRDLPDITAGEIEQFPKQYRIMNPKANLPIGSITFPDNLRKIRHLLKPKPVEPPKKFKLQEPDMYVRPQRPAGVNHVES